MIHYDDQDNLNCMLAGKKRFLFFHPKRKNEFEAHPNKKKNGFGWVDAALDRSVAGYGGFFQIGTNVGRLLQNSVSLARNFRQAE